MANLWFFECEQISAYLFLYSSNIYATLQTTNKNNSWKNTSNKEINIVQFELAISSDAVTSGVVLFSTVFDFSLFFNVPSLTSSSLSVS